MSIASEFDDVLKGCPSGMGPPETDSSMRSLDPAAFVKSGKEGNFVDILVRGAKCGACLSKIENAVENLPEVTSARLNLTTGKLHTVWQTTSFDPLNIIKKLNELGYGAAPFDPDEISSHHNKKERQLLLCLAVAGFAAANIMLLSVSVWADVGEMGSVTKSFMHWVSAAIAFPAVAFSGRPFFGSAVRAIKGGHVNMDVPISLAVLLALGMSLYETINHGVHTYFDAAVMLLFFLLIGKFLDARLQRRAHSAAEDLAAMQAVSVTRIDDDGTARAVKASDLLPGQTIQIAPGERFAVDVEIFSGISDLDTRLVTGETRPVHADVGARVYAGTINVTNSLFGKVLATTEDSMLAEISKLLDAGEQKRSTYRKIADTAARIYVPLVHTLAALTFLGWYAYAGDLKQAIFTAIAVLIITCPCALALAAPVVQVVAVGALFKRHVYLKSGDALERIATCQHVILDKTGTLTEPVPVLNEGDYSSPALLSAAQLARSSRHPYSRAIVTAAGAGPLAKEVTEVPGKGVFGLVDGRYAKLGTPTWVVGENVIEKDALCFSFEEEQPVFFSFSERPVQGAHTIASELKKRGITSEVLSGDSEERVARLAKNLGLHLWTAKVSPVAKALRLEELENQGISTLMVGDGLNDAGAIAQAKASLTPGGAVDISRSASDGVFSSNDISVIPEVIDIARSARLRMLENFGFAALYNAVAIPLAVLGHVTPLVAAIAMSGSSLVVTLNALRLTFNSKR